MKIYCFVCDKSTYGVTIDEDILCVGCDSNHVDVLDISEESSEDLNSENIISILRTGYHDVLSQNMTEIYDVNINFNEEKNEEGAALINSIWELIEQILLNHDGEIINTFRETIIDFREIIDISNNNMSFMAQVFIDDIIRNNINIDNNPRAVSKDYKKELKKLSFKITKSKLEDLKENDTCVICYDKYKIQGKKCIKLPACDHAFHMKCIGEWFKKNNSCPICRKQVPTDNEVYNKVNNICWDGVNVS